MARADPAILVRDFPVSPEPLLQTKLAIFKPARPYGLPYRFFSVTRRVGDLIIKVGLAVGRPDHHIFRIIQFGQSAGAWGRRHRMGLADAAAPPCDVGEWLEKETTLKHLILPAARDRLVRT